MSMELIVQKPTVTAAVLFAPGGVDKVIAEVETRCKEFNADVSTPAGRKEIASFAYQIARSKTGLDDIGKEHVAHLKEAAKVIDIQRKKIRDRFDALQTDVRAPLTEWETRIETIEAELVKVIELADPTKNDISVSAIGNRLVLLDNYSEYHWDEFAHRFTEAYNQTRDKLTAQLAAAEKQERDFAELAQLRKEKADREAAELIRQATEAREAKAKADAEAKAAREKHEAEQRAIREENARIAAEAQAKLAAERAVEAERKRIADQKAAQESLQAKRVADFEHREQVDTAVIEALRTILSKEDALDVHTAIYNNKIPHVTLNY